MMSKGVKAYIVDKFELVLFSTNMMSKSSNVVFNVTKVHEIRCLKVLRHINISTNGWFSDLSWHLDLLFIMWRHFLKPERKLTKKLVKHDWYTA